MKKILIIGGGFAGIKCALDLEKAGLKDSKITLVSNMSHFEYHALLYRVVTGVSPLEVCISLNQIFKNKHVEVVKDEIVEVDIYNKQALARSQSRYTFDYLVLALGSETDYFNVQGLQKNAFTLKTTDDALKL
ncbi:MAG TPA: FAD-dependent oxidoreductase, partial [Candidatus Saccharimonadales bacterium]|nr:FAD-dependent oxidoreductase [Candidatus Saccharimonadales bacterium]